MENKPKNPLAFPWCGDLNDCPTINLGMPLRDYFAAHAPEPPKDWVDNRRYGIEHARLRPYFGDLNGGPHSHIDEAALRVLWSYCYAEAMLRQREFMFDINATRGDQQWKIT